MNNAVRVRVCDGAQQGAHVLGDAGRIHFIHVAFERREIEERHHQRHIVFVSKNVLRTAHA